MAKTATINVRMEPEIKRQAEDLFSALGMSMSEAFNIFTRQALRERGLPFVVTTEPPYANKLRMALAEVERGETELFDNLEDLLADLEGDKDEEDDEDEI